jgi:tryptophanyl-tRNA synthetase
MEKRILSGIRATSKLHIGNYLGALKQFIDIQNTGEFQCYFFIADLHALTTPFEPKELRKNSLEVAAEFIAAGLDPKKSVIFLQNQVHEHSELAWIFECITPLGELERMTQFKDKSAQNQKNINAGLLCYPALMAADILMYKPFAVPVGEDQTQHIELSRIIARKFNKQFGQTFPEPKNYALKPLRIQSLKNPEKKMSKTGDEPLYLDDTPEITKSKIKKAVTATDTSGSSLGAENLFYLLSHFGTVEHIAYFADMKKSGNVKYSELKEILAEDISNHFADFRNKKKELLENPDKLITILADGAKKARHIASQTLEEVKKKIGLI